MNSAEHFEKYGCIKISEFFSTETIRIISRYLENKLRRGEWVEKVEPGEEVTKLWYYADPLLEVFLQENVEVIEKIIGKNIIPTYSYARIYQPGESLRPHVDRPSCEISVTVNVATKGDFSPIYIKYKDNENVKYILNSGDAVIYKGCEATHWRDELKEGQLNVQFMLHYVDKNGHNASYEKDNRPMYGMNDTTRRI